MNSDPTYVSDEEIDPELIRRWENLGRPRAVVKHVGMRRRDRRRLVALTKRVRSKLYPAPLLESLRPGVTRSSALVLDLAELEDRAEAMVREAEARRKR